MNTRKSLAVVAVSAALLSPGLSFADSYWHAAPGERGYKEYPDHLQQGGSNSATPAAGAGRTASTRDQFYRSAGPEGAPQLVPHSYAIKGGKIIHTDTFDHATKRPSTQFEPTDQKSLRESKAGG